MNLKLLRRQCCWTPCILHSSAFSPLVRVTNGQLKNYSCSISQPRSQISSLSNALRVLDLVCPKPVPNHTCGSDLRLIEGFLRRHPEHNAKQQLWESFSFLQEKPWKKPHRKITSSPSRKEDAISVALQVQRGGLSVDADVATNAISACGFMGSLHFGVQLHCLAFRDGVWSDLYVGNSLVGFYSKCGNVGSACKVFNEMPLKNVVSWTALILGFAREWQVDTCFGLYSLMRESTLEPNDITFTSILSACMGSGSLGCGKSTHCQVIHLGFDSYVHIANALISMYCKCGDIHDAFRVFESMCSKDIISWNSMITGHAFHGFHDEVIGLFKKMNDQRFKPNSITYLGVLSSCCHGGFLDHARFAFSSMIENGVTPHTDHYSCMVDLLCRAGLLKEARDFILKMPIQPNAIMWATLLASCRLHGDVWIGIEAAKNRLALEPECAASHVQLANLYAAVGLWGEAARVRKVMKERVLKTYPGHSLIEIEHQVYQFGADDTLSCRSDEILMVLDSLAEALVDSDHVIERDEDINGYLCM